MAAATFATGRATVVSLAIGVLGLAIGLAVGLTQGVLPGSILMGFVFWVGLSLGGLALLLIGHMAGGSWAAVIRRPLEAMVSALPVALLFFIPIVLLIPQLYPWADAAYVEAHKLVAWKAGYLDTTWFVLRAVLYFGLWVLTAWVYLRGAREQDRAGAGPAGRIGYRLKSQAAAWLVVYVLTITLATTDWTMSLTPEWWSGIYGVVFMIGQAISAIALVILTVVWTADRSARMDELLTEKRLQDLGNFLMAFTMFWAYVNASQLIIQWSNNVVETNTFYNLRLNQEPWAGMGIYLLVAGFALPFVVLFSRWVKRKRGALAFMAGWALLTQVVHVYWYVAPEVDRAGLPGVADLAILIGLGGVWFAAYFRSLGSRSVVPEHDPRLLAAEHVAHGAHHDAGTAAPEVRHAG